MSETSDGNYDKNNKNDNKNDNKNGNKNDNKNSQQTNTHDTDGYWRANIRLMLALLSVWFVVSFGFGIILVDWLNQIQFFGFKFGFWWAQQGSIYVFVILIFVYTIRMRAIDKQYGVSDEEDK